MTKRKQTPKLPFKEYFNRLSSEKRIELRRKIREEMLVEDSTIYRWVNGQAYPNDKKAEKVASIVGTSPEKLFPQYKKEGYAKFHSKLRVSRAG